MPKKGKVERSAALPLPPVVGVVADNLRAVMAYHRRLAADGHDEAEPRLGTLQGLEGYIEERVESGEWPDAIAPGKSTIGRMRKGDNPVGLDVLDVVARAYGLQPWHLLVPGLNPANPPYIRATSIEEELDRAYQEVRARVVDAERITDEADTAGRADGDRDHARPARRAPRRKGVKQRT